MVDAVLFDMGGVLVTGPFGGFARYEAHAGLPPGTIRRLNATDPDTNAWAHFERGEIGRAEFVRRFEREAAELGLRVDAEAVLASMRAEPVPEMIEALVGVHRRCATALCTNNLSPLDRSSPVVAAFIDHIDVVVESSVEGLRKPDPEFYRLACERLDVPARRCAFLDDLGVNLAPARAMGMVTIKVVDPVAAAAELEALVGTAAPSSSSSGAHRGS